MLQIHLVFETCVGFKGYMVFPVAKDHIYCSLRNHSDTISISQEIQLCKDRQNTPKTPIPMFYIEKTKLAIFPDFFKKIRYFDVKQLV